MAKITTITVSRLYNLGNYEHQKYELTAQLDDADDAGKVLQGLETFLEDLNPCCPVSHYQIERARKHLAEFDPSNETPSSLTTINSAFEVLQKAQEWKKARQRVFESLGKHSILVHSEPEEEIPF